MIRIIAKKDGFRRCGIAHSKEATEYPADHFTAEQLKALKAEPMLVVSEVEEGSPAAKRTKDGKVQDGVALIEAAKTPEELAALIEGDDREGIKKAAEKRRLELTQG